MTAPHRRAKGERFPQAKLTDAKVTVIKGLLRQKARQRAIAAQFGVSEALINKINRDIYWKHVPWPDKASSSPMGYETSPGVGQK